MKRNSFLYENNFKKNLTKKMKLNNVFKTSINNLSTANKLKKTRKFSLSDSQHKHYMKKYKGKKK